MHFCVLQNQQLQMLCRYAHLHQYTHTHILVHVHIKSTSQQQLPPNAGHATRFSSWPKPENTRHCADNNNAKCSAKRGLNCYGIIGHRLWSHLLYHLLLFNQLEYIWIFVLFSFDCRVMLKVKGQLESVSICFMY